MKLIDKKDYLAIGAFDFGQDSLQASGKLAAILRFRSQGIETETEQALIAQAFRDFSSHNSLRQALSNFSNAEAEVRQLTPGCYGCLERESL